MSSSAFDFLLDDLLVSTTASTTLSKDTQANEKEANQVYDWQGLNKDVLHPDAFDSELEALVAATYEPFPELATLQALSTPFDTFKTADNIIFSQYRGATAQSAYSGYEGAPSTITSESLSTYGSIYEPFDKIPDAAAANSGPQHHAGFTSASTSLSALFPDLDFSGINLSVSSSTSEHGAPTASSTTNSMLPRLTLETDASASRTATTSTGDQRHRSLGNSSAYDSASPYDSKDSSAYFPLPATNAGIAPNYLGNASHPSLAGGLGVGPSGTIKAKVEPISAAASSSEADPRKKYQCPSCPRAFARAFNLKTHMATHDPNRVKSFVCRHSGCGRSFSRKHDLGRHLVSIHQDNTGVTNSSSSTSPIGAGSTSSPKRLSPGSIGIGSGDKERIWCDSCGRGWLAGSRDACQCEQTD